MKRFQIIILCVLFFSSFSPTNLLANQRGIKLTAKTADGKPVPLYSESYALVIGNGNYTNGWDPLSGAIRDVKDVARALEENGFTVILKTDLTKAEFSKVFGNFCYQYGRGKNNRLLFYYAGHGHTQKMFTGEDLGYLVMVDAPVPEKDPMGFRLSSVDMQVIVTEAKMIQAQHVLFMFDSCFSGSLLNLRERVVPEAISDSISLPVRQFITAGRANEPVPDHSIFKQAFLDLLEGRDKEPIPDGYITGEELGLYLKNKVPQYNAGQHPQYGKIKDIRLDKGDFVFALKMEPPSRSPAVPESGGIKEYDKIIQERETNRKEWDKWQSQLENDLAKVDQYDKSSVLNAKEKAEAWKGLLASYSADNPYSVKDDEFRKRAEERSRYWKEYKKAGKLFVDVSPANAEIKILNIGPKFYQGMELDPGKYQIEVSASDYKTERKWVELRAGEDENISIYLESVVTDDPGVRLLMFSSVSGGFAEAENGGRFFVIRGVVANKYPEPRSFTLIKGSILDDQGKVVQARTSYAGNSFTEEELKTLPFSEISKAMENRDGMARKNFNVYSGAAIPFMIVFENLEGNLSEFTVEAVSSSPALSSSTPSVMHRLPIFDEWMQDDRFAALPPAQKQNILSNYFDKEMTDKDFNALPADIQAQIRNNFLSTHSADLGQNKKSTHRASDRDGIYVAYANGIVRDTSTGLEWVAGPDKDTTLVEAKSWVENLNLDGGGWRMPTMDELEGLYRKGSGDRNMTSLLKTTGLWVWSGETKDSSDAWGFSIDGRNWDYRNYSEAKSAASPSPDHGQQVDLVPWKDIVSLDEWQTATPEMKQKVFHEYMADLGKTPEWQDATPKQKFLFTQGIMRDGGLGPDRNGRAFAVRSRGDGLKINPDKSIKGKLFVDTVPSGARIRVLNIRPIFHQGMELGPGSYQVEVSEQGYKTDKTWVNLNAGEDKRLEIQLEQLEVANQPSPTYTFPSLNSEVIEREGIYVVYANGVVKDMGTGLEWFVGPDKDTTWHEAKSWVESLSIGGWRMPTTYELKSLYRKGIGDRNMTPLLNTTGLQVWSGDTEDSYYAWKFNFYIGRKSCLLTYKKDSTRAFAVRSRSDG